MNTFFNRLKKLNQTLAAIICLLAITQFNLPVSRADSPPNLQLEPNDVQVYTGHTGLTTLRLDAAANLTAVEVTLLFNPQLIAVQDADPATAGTQIEVDAGLGGQVIRNQADNNSGRIDLAVVQLPPAADVSQLAHITWAGLTEGVAVIMPTNVVLTGQTGENVESTTQTGVIKVTAAQANSIFGRVLLQGRRLHNGSEVYLTETDCPEPPVNIRTGSPAVTTDSAGYFEFLPAAGVTYRCLQVFQHGYLVAQAANPTGDLGTITLPGGDINDDGSINIFDMAYIGSHYGDNNPLIDINGDGTVSIFDLVLAASNYGLTGPVTDWQ